MSANLFQTIRRPMYGAGSLTAYTGTAGTSPALPVGANAVWVLCTTAAYVKVGIDPTAVAEKDFPVAANVGIVLPLEKPTNPGSDGVFKVSAVQVAAGGNLHIIPLAE